jgi:hypothetical protein
MMILKEEFSDYLLIANYNFIGKICRKSGVLIHRSKCLRNKGNVDEYL